MPSVTKLKVPTLVYITSDSRSGSTLLDLLLGNHSEIVSVGELRRLQEHLNEHLACTCNRAVSECSFWREVDLTFDNKPGTLKNISTLIPRSPNAPADLVFSLGLGSLITLGRKLPFITRSIDIAKNNHRIVDAISKVAKKPIVVDSSKVPKAARLLYLLRPRTTRVIFLKRDGRGVAYSRSQHGGYSFTHGALHWMVYILKSALLWVSLPKSNRLSIKYEDLCKNTEGTLGQICTFLGIEYQFDMAQLEKRDRHNICGSPMRFQYDDKEIRLDERWRHGMKKRDKRNFLLIGGTLLNWMLGYRFK